MTSNFFYNAMIKHTLDPKQIIFKVIVNGKFSHNIIIPPENKFKIEINYLYNNIATHLNVPQSVLNIPNFTRGWLICPAEFIEDEHRTIRVTIN